MKITKIIVDAFGGDNIHWHLQSCVDLANQHNCCVETSLNNSNFIIRKNDSVDEMLKWHHAPRNTWDSGDTK